MFFLLQAPLISDPDLIPADSVQFMNVMMTFFSHLFKFCTSPSLAPPKKALFLVIPCSDVICYPTRWEWGMHVPSAHTRTRTCVCNRTDLATAMRAFSCQHRMPLHLLAQRRASLGPGRARGVWTCWIWPCCPAWHHRWAVRPMSNMDLTSGAFERWPTLLVLEFGACQSQMRTNKGVWDLVDFERLWRESKKWQPLYSSHWSKISSCGTSFSWMI